MAKKTDDYYFSTPILYPLKKSTMNGIKIKNNDINK